MSHLLIDKGFHALLVNASGDRLRIDPRVSGVVHRADYRLLVGDGRRLALMQGSATRGLVISGMARPITDLYSRNDPTVPPHDETAEE